MTKTIYIPWHKDHGFDTQRVHTHLVTAVMRLGLLADICCADPETLLRLCEEAGHRVARIDGPDAQAEEVSKT